MLGYNRNLTVSSVLFLAMSMPSAALATDASNLDGSKVKSLVEICVNERQDLIYPEARLSFVADVDDAIDSFYYQPNDGYLEVCLPKGKIFHLKADGDAASDGSRTYLLDHSYFGKARLTLSREAQRDFNNHLAGVLATTSEG